MSATAGSMPDARLRAPYQDVLDAPPHKVAQIIDGTLHLHPRPPWRHGLAASRLLARIGQSFFGSHLDPGGWVILYEPEVHFGEDVVVPEIAGWRIENFILVQNSPWQVAPPDWVCEVPSDKTREVDTGRKKDIYAREGVPHLWFVNPETETLEAFVLEDQEWTRIAALAGDAEVSIPPFDAIGFRLSCLWHPKL